MVEAVGWVSSLILVLTIAKQVYKQWRIAKGDISAGSICWIATRPSRT